MAALCIGGVCIPYSAILPFCAFVLQFLATQLVKWGILPAAFVPPALRPSETNSSNGGACTVGNTSTSNTTKKVRRSATDKRIKRTATSSTATSSSSSDDDDNDDNNTCSKVTNISSTEEWNDMMQNERLTVVAKFTADWCKPCKAIDPLFCQLAKEYGVPGRVQFVRVDVDEYDEIAQTAKVVMMPTFALFDSKGCKIAAVNGAKEDLLKRMLDTLVGKKGQ